jgi:hypothetical protein
MRGNIRVWSIPSGGFTAGDSAARCSYQPNFKIALKREAGILTRSTFDFIK